MSYINQIVNVDAFYFSNCLGTTKSFPRQIDLNNKKYTFSDGLQYLVKTGQRVLRVFEMTDGERIFRLHLENNRWTLVGTR